MEEKLKKHLSPFIAWGIVVLCAGVVGFAVWYYWNQIDSICNSINIVAVKKTDNADKTKTTTDTSATATWKTYTNSTYGYSIQYPPTMTYRETESAKNIDFQTAEEKATFEACQTKEATECITGHQIGINVDVTAGTTNADDLILSIEDIVNKRVERMIMAQNPVSTTLSQQPAYEGISIGMLESYNIVSKYNNHIYDISLICAVTAPSLENCKEALTADQQKMLASFKFITL